MTTLLKTISAACGLTLCLSLPVAAQGEFQYEVGAGEASSDFVLDFRGSGSEPGGVYRFTYRYEPGSRATALDFQEALVAVPTATGPNGPLSISGSPNFPSTFAIGDDAATPAFFPDSQFWGYILEGGTTENSFGLPEGAPPLISSYEAAAFADAGPADRFLEDGSLDVRLVVTSTPDGSVSPFLSDYIAAVPEPASAGLLAAGALLLTRRRRAAA